MSDFIFSAIELAHESDVDVSSLTSLVTLCVTVHKQLFCHTGNEKANCESDESASDSLTDETEVTDDNLASDSIFSNSCLFRSIQNTLNRSQVAYEVESKMQDDEDHSMPLITICLGCSKCTIKIPIWI